jgi:hypothetical protein
MLPEWMAERKRRFTWERNDMDYMGRDSFENIRRRLDEVILTEEGARCVERGIDVLADTGEDVVAAADVPDSPALPESIDTALVPEMYSDEVALPPYILTGTEGERPSQSFIGWCIKSVVRMFGR